MCVITDNNKVKNVFAITLFCLLTIGHLYSQTGCCPYISSITITPTSPTTNDTIKIVTSTTTPSFGSKISYTYTQQSDTFDLVGCFWEGMATQPRTFLDTTNIGLLTAGTYLVNYIAYSSISSTSCSVIDTNSMTTSFQVTATSGLENLNLSDQNIPGELLLSIARFCFFWFNKCKAILGLI